MPGTRSTTFRALIAIASAPLALALALSAPAPATPGAPCEEVVYVGVCVPVGGPQGPVVQHPNGEYALTPDASSNANSIG